MSRRQWRPAGSRANEVHATCGSSNSLSPLESHDHDHQDSCCHDHRTRRRLRVVTHWPGLVRPQEARRGSRFRGSGHRLRVPPPPAPAPTHWPRTLRRRGFVSPGFVSRGFVVPRLRGDRQNPARRNASCLWFVELRVGFASSRLRVPPPMETGRIQSE